MPRRRRPPYRSEGRILTNHADRLPNPTNIQKIPTARAEDPESFDKLMKDGVADIVRKQVELKNDIHSGLLLDSRVVELTKARHPIFVIMSSSKSLFFKNLKVKSRALGQIAAQEPGI
jgi:hypothetical protein